mgnify:CR=1 FL=1
MILNMTKEEFKKQLEYPLNHEDADFWKSIHTRATIERTLRLALQYPSLAQEYLDSLPKATMD